ncbi:MAG: hypothetical protein RMH74_00435 [Candidatus Caldarchaeum sp.]|nr:hypothetical protein [Candidatus Caldarchaeum sp.]
MLAVAATIPVNTQSALTLFLLMTICVSILYSLVLVYGVKRLRPSAPSQSRVYAAPPPRPSSPPLPTPAMAVKQQPPQEDYFKRLEKLDEAVKLIEERLKKPAKQETPKPEEKGEDVEELELEELKQILDLAISLRDEVSKIAARR